MPSQLLLMNVMRFLHNLFTAIWIGGMLLMAVVILPGIRKNPKISEPMMVINGIQDRIKPFALVSMAGLAITGMLLGKSSKSFTGLMDFGTPYMTTLSVKHILIVVMVILAFVRLSINKRVKIEKKMELQKVSAGILALNAMLGVVVLFLSSMI
jgi:putative copper export protein